MKKILIAVDNDPISETAASAGFEFAKLLNAEIAILSVVDNTNLMTTGGVTPQEIIQEIEMELRKSQELLVERVFKDHKVWTFVKKEKPSAVILESADEWQADLIVVGTHNKTGFAHLLSNTVAEKLAKRYNCNESLLAIQFIFLIRKK